MDNKIQKTGTSEEISRKNKRTKPLEVINGYKSLYYLKFEVSSLFNWPVWLDVRGYYKVDNFEALKIAQTFAHDKYKKFHSDNLKLIVEKFYDHGSFCKIYNFIWRKN